MKEKLYKKLQNQEEKLYKLNKRLKSFKISYYICILFIFSLLSIILFIEINNNRFSIFVMEKTNFLIDYSTINKSEINCNYDGNLYNTLICLSKYSKFKYNINNAGKKLSLEEIQNNGGVCEHSSELFIYLIEVINKRFNTNIRLEKIIMPLNKEGWHSVLLVYDENEWHIISVGKVKKGEKLDYLQAGK